MRAGSIIAVIFFICYLSYEIDSSNNQPIDTYMSQHLNERFIIKDDTFQLGSNQPIIFYSKTDTFKINNDSLFRLNDDKFLIKYKGSYLDCEYVKKF